MLLLGKVVLVHASGQERGVWSEGIKGDGFKILVVFANKTIGEQNIPQLLSMEANEWLQDSVTYPISYILLVLSYAKSRMPPLC